MKHNLSTLSVLHYVYGVLICLGGFALLGLVLPGSLLSNPWFLQQGGEAAPIWVSYFLQALGWGLFVLFETHGVMNLISGRMIDKRKGRTFTQVIAAINCLNIPFGIGLGIFTFVVLGDREVREQYGLMA